MMRALHAEIAERHAASYAGSPMTMVHLGDYVDRGPDSRGVIEDLIAMQAYAAERDDLEVINLRGNHEQMMIDAFEGDRADVDFWLSNGGQETAMNYRGPTDEGGQFVIEMDADHIKWLTALPTLHYVPDRKLVFVHAGVDVATFPESRDEVHLWTRSPKFFRDETWPEAMAGLTVVHGHTPSPDNNPWIGKAGRRIGVDTGACFNGPLTAVVLAPGEPPEFIQVGAADDLRAYGS